MESPTQEQWESAESNAKILEEKIATLVEEFEQKHKPIQVNVLTRWRDYKDKYKMAQGGAAQVVLHDCSVCADQGLPSIALIGTYTNPNEHIFYADVEV